MSGTRGRIIFYTFLHNQKKNRFNAYALRYQKFFNSFGYLGINLIYKILFVLVFYKLSSLYRYSPITSICRHILRQFYLPLFLAINNTDFSYLLFSVLFLCFQHNALIKKYHWKPANASDTGTPDL